MDDRASLWTRFTDRANVVVWALPLPRRAKALLSRLVYQNPPMPIASVLLVLGILDAVGVETVVMGGWGVDALVGEQRRAHRDLDLILDHSFLEPALVALAALGFAEWFRNPHPEPYGGHGIEGEVVVLRNEAMQVVDLHPMCLSALNEGVAVGSIAGRDVSCVSASLQLKALARAHMRSRRERRRHAANLAGARQAHEQNVAV